MTAPSYDELERFFCAYLNTNWPVEYGSVDVALDAYCAETADEARRAAVAAFDDLLASEKNDAEIAAELAERGNAYAFVEDESPRAFAAELRARIAGSLEGPGRN